jgi:hypothetical protein
VGSSPRSIPLFWHRFCWREPHHASAAPHTRWSSDAHGHAASRVGGRDRRLLGIRNPHANQYSVRSTSLVPRVVPLYGPRHPLAVLGIFSRLLRRSAPASCPGPIETIVFGQVRYSRPRNHLYRRTGHLASAANASGAMFQEWRTRPSRRISYWQRAAGSAQLTRVRSSDESRSASFSLWPVKTMWLLVPLWVGFPGSGEDQTFNLGYVLLLAPQHGFRRLMTIQSSSGCYGSFPRRSSCRPRVLQGRDSAACGVSLSYSPVRDSSRCLRRTSTVARRQSRKNRRFRASSMTRGTSPIPFSTRSPTPRAGADNQPTPLAPLRKMLGFPRGLGSGLTSSSTGHPGMIVADVEHASAFTLSLAQRVGPMVMLRLRTRASRCRIAPTS